MKEFSWEKREETLNGFGFEELKALSTFWSDHQWGIVAAVAGMNAEEREVNKKFFRSLEERLRRANPNLGPHNGLPFLNSALGLSEDNLNMLNRLAPKDFKKGSSDSKPFVWIG